MQGNGAKQPKDLQARHYLADSFQKKKGPHICILAGFLILFGVNIRVTRAEFGVETATSIEVSSISSARIAR
jgi:hypothetical protein